MKRNSVVCLSLLLSMLIAGPSIILAGQDPRFEYKKHTWELGTELSYRKYQEPNVMHQTGYNVGLVGSYEYHDKWMFKAEARGDFGDIDYVGGTQGGTYLNLNNVPEYMLEARALVGYDFPVWKSTVVTYFTGFGYRYLNNNAHKKYPGGYERESNYFYSPLGMAFHTNLGNGWSVEEIAEFDYFWRGEQKSHLADTQSGFPDVSNTQRDGYGLRGSVTAEKKWRTVILEAGAFVRYWNIKDSDVEFRDVGGLTFMIWEPKNETTEVGIKLGVKF